MQIPVAGLAQGLPRRLGIASIDATGQLTNAAVRTETVGMAQHHRLLGEGMAAGVARFQPGTGKGIPTDLLQPLAGLLVVAASLGIPAQIAQYRTGLHRG